MNGREKSHSAIVAVKPTNKAGRPVAEPAEPRAGTEGNAAQGGTLRTLNREGASHGLDRVRKAARERRRRSSPRSYTTSPSTRWKRRSANCGRTQRRASTE